jgi:hypothetical protein
MALLVFTCIGRKILLKVKCKITWVLLYRYLRYMMLLVLKLSISEGLPENIMI